MSLNESVVLMKQSLLEVEEHLNKLQSGRKSSSAKARSSLMALKKSSHALRSDIMKYTKELPVKSRVKKEVKTEETPMEEVEEPEPEVEQEEKKAATKKARTKRVKKVNQTKD